MTRETIGWVEQEPGNGNAYYCFRDSSGRKVEWLLVEMTCRPPSGGGGGHGKRLPAALKVAA